MTAPTQYPAPDSSDFRDASAGHISILKPDIIFSATNKNEIIWDNSAYDFIHGDEVPETVKPSLWRQG
jgi:alkyl sulfatase BDS1-like metallo-beta-lactamase superfamily hydrolase